MGDQGNEGGTREACGDAAPTKSPTIGSRGVPVFVVLRQTGEYSDAYFTPVCVFHTEGAAQAFCDAAQAQRDAAYAAHPDPRHSWRTDRGWDAPEDDEDRARKAEWKRIIDARRAMMTLDPESSEDSSWEVCLAPLIED